MDLVIDIGNSRVKMGVFKDDILIETMVFDKKIIISQVKNIVAKKPICKGIISCVINISETKYQKLLKLLPFIQLSVKTKVPFINLYKTKKTLGIDRIALVSAAQKKYRNKNVLIIDAGTCLTFDFINSKKQYFGGSISPGIKMRYDSLHTFTSKLPLLKINHPNNFIGNTTESSIHCGIINGISNEIEATINQYKNKFSDLTIVLTGGDTYFLAKQLKSSIFAKPNFILEGLHAILKYNKKND